MSLLVARFGGQRPLEVVEHREQAGDQLRGRVVLVLLALPLPASLEAVKVLLQPRQTCVELDLLGERLGSRSLRGGALSEFVPPDGKILSSRLGNRGGRRRVLIQTNDLEDLDIVRLVANSLMRQSF